MSYSVELYFDSRCKDIVCAAWERFAGERIGVPQIAQGFRPHLSLGLCEDLDERAFRPALEAFARETQPFPITLGAVGLFTAPETVLFLAPVADLALVALHERFHRAFAAFAREPFGYYLPGRWVPHVTLTQAIPTERMSRAVELAAAIPIPLEARVERVGLTTYRPAVRRYEFALGMPVASR